MSFSSFLLLFSSIMEYLPLVNKKFCLTVVFVCFALLFYCLGVLFNHPSKRGGDTMANNSSLTDNFVKALSYYLALSGKSKKEVADGIGIPPTTFSSWSNGKHLPDMDRLQNLATYLGAPVSEFFDFTANTSTPDPLLTELTDIFSELSTEDKLLVRDVALRIYKLQHTEE
ncbi:XRE family transcriptional regulator [Mediterraneibacter gnavus]|uniref:XRE family transcriptional regulator n=3 Tax=Bacillota TaxID=1239 RepID=A0A414M0V7_9FIRM|nr:XRE family transcriptional regulator [Mediterraneibacter gnavus]RHF01351.1 XRE family transcriptional regulator [Agathobacter rectalis]